MGKCSSKLERNEDSDSSFQGRGGKPAIGRSASTKDATASAKPSKDKVEDEDVAVVKQEGAFRSGESYSQGSGLVRKRNSKAAALGLESPEKAPASSLGHEEGGDTFHDASEELGPPSVPPSPTPKSPTSSKLESSIFSPSKDSSLATSPPGSGSNRDLASSQALSRVRLNSSSSLPPTRSPPEVPVPALRPTLSQKVSEEAIPSEPSAVSSVSAPIVIPTISAAAPEQAEPTKLDPKSQEHETMKAFVELGDNWELVTRSPLSMIQAGKKGEPESFTTQHQHQHQHETNTRPADKEAEKKMKLDDSASKITLTDASRQIEPVKPVLAVESEKGKVHEVSDGSETTSGSLSPAALLKNEGYTVQEEPLATELKIDKPASISSRSESAGSGEFEIIRGPEDEKSTPRSPSPQISETSQPEIVDSPGDVQTAVDEERYPQFVSTPAKAVSETSHPKSISDLPIPASETPEEQQFTRQKSVKQIVDEIEKGAFSPEFSPTSAAKLKKAPQAAAAQAHQQSNEATRKIDFHLEPVSPPQEQSVEKEPSLALPQDPKTSKDEPLKLADEEKVEAPLQAPTPQSKLENEKDQAAVKAPMKVPQEPVIEPDLENQTQVVGGEPVGPQEVEKKSPVVQLETAEATEDETRYIDLPLESPTAPVEQVEEEAPHPVLPQEPGTLEASPLISAKEKEGATPLEAAAESDPEKEQKTAGAVEQQPRDVEEKPPVVELEPDQATKDPTRDIELPLKSPTAPEEQAHDEPPHPVLPEEPEGLESSALILAKEDEGTAPLEAAAESDPEKEDKPAGVKEPHAVQQEPEAEEEKPPVVELHPPEATQNKTRDSEIPLGSPTAPEEPEEERVPHPALPQHPESLDSSPFTLAREEEGAAPLEAAAEREPGKEEKPAGLEEPNPVEQEPEGVKEKPPVAELQPPEATPDETRDIELPLESPTAPEEPVEQEALPPVLPEEPASLEASPLILAKEEEGAAPSEAAAEGDPAKEDKTAVVKEPNAVEQEPEGVEEKPPVAELEPAEPTEDETRDIQLPLESHTAPEEPVEEEAPPLVLPEEPESLDSSPLILAKEEGAAPLQAAAESDPAEEEKRAGVEEPSAVQDEPQDVEEKPPVVELEPEGATQDETRDIELPSESPTAPEEEVKEEALHPVLPEEPESLEASPLILAKEDEAAAPLEGTTESVPGKEEKTAGVEGPNAVEQEPEGVKEKPPVVELEPAEPTEFETRDIELPLDSPTPPEEPVEDEAPHPVLPQEPESLKSSLLILAKADEGVAPLETAAARDPAKEEKTAGVEEPNVVQQDQQDAEEKQLVVELKRTEATQEETRDIELPLENPTAGQEPVEEKAPHPVLQQESDSLEYSPLILVKEEDRVAPFQSAVERDPEKEEKAAGVEEPNAVHQDQHDVEEKPPVVELEPEGAREDETRDIELPLESPTAREEEVKEDTPHPVLPEKPESLEASPFILAKEEAGAGRLEGAPESVPGKEEKPAGVEEQNAVQRQPQDVEEKPPVVGLDPAGAKEDETRDIELPLESPTAPEVPEEEEPPHPVLLEEPDSLEASPLILAKEEEGAAPLEAAAERDPAKEDKKAVVKEPNAVQQDPEGVEEKPPVAELEPAEPTEDETRDIQLPLESPTAPEEPVEEEAPPLVLPEEPESLDSSPLILAKEEGAAPLQAAAESDPAEEEKTAGVEEPSAVQEEPQDVEEKPPVVELEPEGATQDETRDIELPSESPTAPEEEVKEEALHPVLPEEPESLEASPLILAKKEEGAAPLEAAAERDPAKEDKTAVVKEPNAVQQESEGVEEKPPVAELEPAEPTEDETRDMHLPLESHTAPEEPVQEEAPPLVLPEEPESLDSSPLILAKEEGAAPLQAAAESDPAEEEKRAGVEEPSAVQDEPQDVEEKPPVVELEPEGATQDDTRDIELPLESPTAPEEEVKEEAPHPVLPEERESLEASPLILAKEEEGEAPLGGAAESVAGKEEKPAGVEEPNAVQEEPEGVEEKPGVAELEPAEPTEDETRDIDLPSESPTAPEEPVEEETSPLVLPEEPESLESSPLILAKEEEGAAPLQAAAESDAAEEEKTAGVEEPSAVQEEPQDVEEKPPVVELEPEGATQDKTRDIELPLESPTAPEEEVKEEAPHTVLPGDPESLEASPLILSKEEEGAAPLEAAAGSVAGKEEKPAGVEERNAVEQEPEGGEEKPPGIELEPAEGRQDETRDREVRVESRSALEEQVKGEGFYPVEPEEPEGLEACPLSSAEEEEGAFPWEAAAESDTEKEEKSGTVEERKAVEQEPVVAPEPEQEFEVLEKEAVTGGEIDQEPHVVKKPEVVGDEPVDVTRELEQKVVDGEQTGPQEVEKKPSLVESEAAEATNDKIKEMEVTPEEPGGEEAPSQVLSKEQEKEEIDPLMLTTEEEVAAPLEAPPLDLPEKEAELAAVVEPLAVKEEPVFAPELEKDLEGNAKEPISVAQGDRKPDAVMEPKVEEVEPVEETSIIEPEIVDEEKIEPHIVEKEPPVVETEQAESTKDLTKERELSQLESPTVPEEPVQEKAPSQVPPQVDVDPLILAKEEGTAPLEAAAEGDPEKEQEQEAVEKPVALQQEPMVAPELEKELAVVDKEPITAGEVDEELEVTEVEPVDDTRRSEPEVVEKDQIGPEEVEKEPTFVGLEPAEATQGETREMELPLERLTVPENLSEEQEDSSQVIPPEPEKVAADPLMLVKKEEEAPLEAAFERDPEKEGELISDQEEAAVVPEVEEGPEVVAKGLITVGEADNNQGLLKEPETQKVEPVDETKETELDVVDDKPIELQEEETEQPVVELDAAKAKEDETRETQLLEESPPEAEEQLQEMLPSVVLPQEPEKAEPEPFILAKEAEVATPLEGSVEGESVKEVEQPAVEEPVVESELEKEIEVADKESVPVAEADHDPEVVQVEPTEETKNETREIELPLRTPTAPEEPIVEELPSQVLPEEPEKLDATPVFLEKEEEVADPLEAKLEGEHVKEVEQPAVEEPVVEPELEKEVDVSEKESVPAAEVDFDPEVVEVEPAEAAKDETREIELPLDTPTTPEERIVEEVPSQGLSQEPEKLDAAPVNLEKEEEVAAPFEAEAEGDTVKEVGQPALEEPIVEPELEKEVNVAEKESVPVAAADLDSEVVKEPEVIEVETAEETKDETRETLETPASPVELIVEKAPSQVLPEEPEKLDAGEAILRKEEEAASPLAAEVEGEPVTGVEHPAVEEPVVEPELKREVEVAEKESTPGVEADHEPEFVEGEQDEATKDETREIELPVETQTSPAEPVVEEVLRHVLPEEPEKLDASPVVLATEEELAASLEAEGKSEPVTEVEQPAVEEPVVEPELEKEVESPDNESVPVAEADHDPGEAVKEPEVVEVESAADSAPENVEEPVAVEKSEPPEQELEKELEVSEKEPTTAEEVDQEPEVPEVESVYETREDEAVVPHDDSSGLSEMEKTPTVVKFDPAEVPNDETREIDAPLETLTASDEPGQEEALSEVLSQEPDKVEFDPNVLAKQEEGAAPLQAAPEGDPEDEIKKIELPLDPVSTAEDSAVDEDPSQALPQEPKEVEGDLLNLVKEEPDPSPSEEETAHNEAKKEVEPAGVDQPMAVLQEPEAPADVQKEPEIVDERPIKPPEYEKEPPLVELEPPEATDDETTDREFPLERSITPEKPVPEEEPSQVLSQEEADPVILEKEEEGAAEPLEAAPEGDQVDETKETELPLEPLSRIEEPAVEGEPSQDLPQGAEEVDNDLLNLVEEPVVPHLEEPAGNEAGKDVEPAAVDETTAVSQEREGAADVQKEPEIVDEERIKPPEVEKELPLSELEPAEATENETRDREFPLESSITPEKPVPEEEPSQVLSQEPQKQEADPVILEKEEEGAAELLEAAPEGDQADETKETELPLEPISRIEEPAVEEEPSQDLPQGAEEVDTDLLNMVEEPVVPHLEEPAGNEAGKDVEPAAVDETTAVSQEREGAADVQKEPEIVDEERINPPEVEKELPLSELEPVEATEDETRDREFPLASSIPPEKPVPEEEPSQVLSQEEADPVILEKEEEVAVEPLEAAPQGDQADETKETELPLEPISRIEEPAVEEPSEDLPQGAKEVDTDLLNLVEETVVPHSKEPEGNEAGKDVEPAAVDETTAVSQEREGAADVEKEPDIVDEELINPPEVEKELPLSELEPAEATEDETRDREFPLESSITPEKPVPEKEPSQVRSQEEADPVILEKEEEGAAEPLEAAPEGDQVDETKETELPLEPISRIEEPAVEEEPSQDLPQGTKQVDTDLLNLVEEPVVPHFEEIAGNEAGKEVEAAGLDDPTAVSQEREGAADVQKEPEIVDEERIKPPEVEKELPLSELEPAEATENETRDREFPLESSITLEKPVPEEEPSQALSQEPQRQEADPVILEKEEEGAAEPLEATPEGDPADVIKETELPLEPISRIEEPAEEKEPLQDLPEGAKEVDTDFLNLVEQPVVPHLEEPAGNEAGKDVEPVAIDETTAVSQEREGAADLQKDPDIVDEELINPPEVEKELPLSELEPAEATEDETRDREFPLESLITPEKPLPEEEPSQDLSQEPQKQEAHPISLGKEEEGAAEPLEAAPEGDQVDETKETELPLEPISRIKEPAVEEEPSEDLPQGAKEVDTDLSNLVEEPVAPHLEEIAGNEAGKEVEAAGLDDPTAVSQEREGAADVQKEPEIVDEERIKPPEVEKEPPLVELEPAEATENETRDREFPLESSITPEKPVPEEEPSQVLSEEPQKQEADRVILEKEEEGAVEPVEAAPAVPEGDQVDETKETELPLEPISRLEEPAVEEEPSQDLPQGAEAVDTDLSNLVEEPVGPHLEEPAGNEAGQDAEPAGVEEPMAVSQERAGAVDVKKQPEIVDQEPIKSQEVEKEPPLVELEPAEATEDETRDREFPLESSVTPEKPVPEEETSQVLSQESQKQEADPVILEKEEEGAGEPLEAAPEGDQEDEIKEAEVEPDVQKAPEVGEEQEEAYARLEEQLPEKELEKEVESAGLEDRTGDLQQLADEPELEKKLEVGGEKEEEAAPLQAGPVGEREHEQEPQVLEDPIPVQEEQKVSPELENEVELVAGEPLKVSDADQEPEVLEVKPADKTREIQYESFDAEPIGHPEVEKEPSVAELEPAESTEDETTAINLPLETPIAPEEPIVEEVPIQDTPEDLEKFEAGPVILGKEEDLAAHSEAKVEDEPLKEVEEPAVEELVVEPELEKEVEFSEKESILVEEADHDPEVAEVEPAEETNDETREIELPLETSTSNEEPIEEHVPSEVLPEEPQKLNAGPVILEKEEEATAPSEAEDEGEPLKEVEQPAVEEPLVEPELEKEVEIAQEESIPRVEPDRHSKYLKEPEVVKVNPAEEKKDKTREIELPLETPTSLEEPKTEEVPSQVLPEEPEKLYAGPVILEKEEEAASPLAAEVQSEPVTEVEHPAVEEPLVEPELEKEVEVAEKESISGLEADHEPDVLQEPEVVEGEPDEATKDETREIELPLETPTSPKEPITEEVPSQPEEPITVAEGDQEPIFLKEPEDIKVEPVEAKKETKEIQLPSETQEKELDVATKVEPEVVDEEEEGASPLEVTPEDDSVKEEKSEPIDEPMAAQEEPVTEPELEHELEVVGKEPISLAAVDEAPEAMKEQQVGKVEPIEARKDETRELELPFETSTGLGESISEEIPSQVIEEEPEKVQDDPKEEAVAAPLAAAPEVDLVKEEEPKSLEEPIPAQVELQVDPELEKGLEEAVKVEPEVVDEEEERAAHLQASQQGEPQNEEELTTVEEPTAAQEEPVISQELEKEAELAGEKPITVVQSDRDTAALKEPELVEVEPPEAKLPAVEEPIAAKVEPPVDPELEKEPELANQVESDISKDEEGAAPLPAALEGDLVKEEDQLALEEPIAVQEEQVVEPELDKEVAVAPKVPITEEEVKEKLGDPKEPDIEGVELVKDPEEEIRDTELPSQPISPPAESALNEDPSPALQLDVKDVDTEPLKLLEKDVPAPLEAEASQNELETDLGSVAVEEPMHGLQELESDPADHLKKEPKVVEDEQGAPEVDAPEVEESNSEEETTAAEKSMAVQEEPVEATQEETREIELPLEPESAPAEPIAEEVPSQPLQPGLEEVDTEPSKAVEEEVEAPLEEEIPQTGLEKGVGSVPVEEPIEATKEETRELDFPLDPVPTPAEPAVEEETSQPVQSDPKDVDAEPLKPVEEEIAALLDTISTSAEPGVEEETSRVLPQEEKKVVAEHLNLVEPSVGAPLEEATSGNELEKEVKSDAINAKIGSFQELEVAQGIDKEPEDVEEKEEGAAPLEDAPKVEPETEEEPLAVEQSIAAKDDQEVSTKQEKKLEASAKELTGGEEEADQDPEVVEVEPAEAAKEESREIELSLEPTFTPGDPVVEEEPSQTLPQERKDINAQALNLVEEETVPAPSEEETPQNEVESAGFEEPTAGLEELEVPQDFEKEPEVVDEEEKGATTIGFVFEAEPEKDEEPAALEEPAVSPEMEKEVEAEAKDPVTVAEADPEVVKEPEVVEVEPVDENREIEPEVAEEEPIVPQNIELEQAEPTKDETREIDIPLETPSVPEEASVEEKPSQDTEPEKVEAEPLKLEEPEKDEESAAVMEEPKAVHEEPEVSPELEKEVEAEAKDPVTVAEADPEVVKEPEVVEVEPVDENREIEPEVAEEEPIVPQNIELEQAEPTKDETREIDIPLETPQVPEEASMEENPSQDAEPEKVEAEPLKLEEEDAVVVSLEAAPETEPAKDEETAAVEVPMCFPEEPLVAAELDKELDVAAEEPVVAAEVEKETEVAEEVEPVETQKEETREFQIPLETSAAPDKPLVEVPSHDLPEAPEKMEGELLKLGEEEAEAPEIEPGKDEESAAVEEPVEEQFSVQDNPVISSDLEKVALPEQQVVAPELEKLPEAEKKEIGEKTKGMVADELDEKAGDPFLQGMGLDQDVNFPLNGVSLEESVQSELSGDDVSSTNREAEPLLKALGLQAEVDTCMCASCLYRIFLLKEHSVKIPNLEASKESVDVGVNGLESSTASQVESKTHLDITGDGDNGKWLCGLPVGPRAKDSEASQSVKLTDEQNSVRRLVEELENSLKGQETHPSNGNDPILDESKDKPTDEPSRLKAGLPGIVPSGNLTTVY